MYAHNAHAAPLRIITRQMNIVMISVRKTLVIKFLKQQRSPWTGLTSSLSCHSASSASTSSHFSLFFLLAVQASCQHQRYREDRAGLGLYGLCAALLFCSSHKSPLLSAVSAVGTVVGPVLVGSIVALRHCCSTRAEKRTR